MHRSILIAASAAFVALSIVAISEPAAASSRSAVAVSAGDNAATDFSARRKRHARKHRAARSYAAHPDCNVTMPCIGVGPSKFGAQFERENIMGKARPRYTPRASIDHGASGLVAPLAAKLSSIQAACPGTVAVSGVRHTYIAGTKRISLHASGKAVDVQGPYGCIYAQLRGWSGGYTTDARRMRHIHISYDAQGGREMGQAFRHGGGRKYARHKAGHRHARHHRHRPHYATAHPR